MRKINLLDIIIIFIVLMACIIGYNFIKGTENNVATASTTKVIYQIRTTETMDKVYDLIEIGTPIYEIRKNYCIGTIIDKQSEPTVRYAVNSETGEYVGTEIDGRKDVILTIEVNAEKGTQNILVQDFALRVGTDVYVKGKGYAAMGYIVSIER